MGPDYTRHGGLEHGSRASIKKGFSERGQARGVSRFFGLWPLLGGDDASKASCGIIRSGSGEPWFNRKNEEGEICGIHGAELGGGESPFSLLIVLLNRRLDDYGTCVFGRIVTEGQPIVLILKPQTETDRVENCLWHKLQYHTATF